MAGLLETCSYIKEHSVVWFFHVNGVTPVEIYSQLVDLHVTHVTSLKQVWILRSTFDNGKADIDNKQQPGCSSTSIIDNNECQADALIREENGIKLTLLMSQTCHWIMCTALTMTKWITEKCVHAVCERTSQTIEKLITWDSL
jgi:hypothetical protein